ncbi:MAG: TraM recognition domain-containing protein [Alphaproteobacteria bacterium]|nr:TraM recognition domain-containing protein [Alphaproteobacteria bacterium]
MVLDTRKYSYKHTDILRDTRPWTLRVWDWMKRPANSGAVFISCAILPFIQGDLQLYIDWFFLVAAFFFFMIVKADRTIAFKMPMGAKYKDKNNEGPGKSGQAEGILYMGNVKETSEEVWFSDSDTRTHILYLGTTGAGKTEGLKSLVTNALCWASGFVYVDGKADTDLWSSLSSLMRRFGRDDDLLILNYMTGNSDSRAPSNTMNPFSSGSASYLTNMLVSLMPESGGDNAMWKERAVSLVGSIMPALTWKRDYQDIPMSVTTIREYLGLNAVIALSRDEMVPEEIRKGIVGYLDTLPGFVPEAFDDNGKEKPAGPDSPPIDTTTAHQQHGYLSMQFTRSLQSLGDDYGYIFDSQAADVDMVDVVLNRRVLIVLIPALEKSGDETANLGKIVASTLKGMMGSTLGSTVEGEASTVIDNKPTKSMTPFMTVFDEVGYYTAEGMAVMAAQARSLGFSLIYAAQDLPALEKRVKEEARSITANCNIKIFGKLEDPTQTKEFFEKTVGASIVTEVSGFQTEAGSLGHNYTDGLQAGVQIRDNASYDELRSFKEGQAVVTFGGALFETQMFYSNPGHAKAMRVTRYMALPPPDENLLRNAKDIRRLRDNLVKKGWSAEKADVAIETPPEIDALLEGYNKGIKHNQDGLMSGLFSIVDVHALDNALPAPLEKKAPKGIGSQSPEIDQKELKAETKVAAEASKTLQTPAETKAPSAPAETPAAPAATEQPQQAAPDNTDPMGFFGATPATEAAAPSAPEKQPAAQTQTAPPVEQTTTQPAAEAAPSDNPMGFFTGGAETAAPETAPSEAEAVATPEIAHKTSQAATPPSTEPAAATPAASEPQAPQEIRRGKINASAENLLKDAGKQARDKLVKAKEEGAAE